MDILCPKCSEPWEIDCLHDLVEEEKYSSFDQAFKKFRKVGCAALDSKCYNHQVSDLRLQQIQIIYDLMGDDVDGCASSFEDLGLE